MQYRVVDMVSEQEQVVTAASPEAAARNVLGVEVVRSGVRRNLVARAYWQYADQPLSMVRLYRRLADMDQHP